MKVLPLSFSASPAEYTAEYLRLAGLDPVSTLVVSPTQRFKTYFASSLLRLNRGRECISPYLTTSAQLVRSVAAMSGRRVANEMEKFSMLHTACGKTRGFGEVFPQNALSSFVSFRGIARKLLKAFEEMEREERSPVDFNYDEDNPRIDRQYRVLKTIYRNYSRIQEDSQLFDISGVTRGLTEEVIRDYFRDYDAVVAVSLLSLTGFEQRLFHAVEKKLTVIYQDTGEYDFSKIITYRAKSAAEKPPDRGRCYFLETSSRIAQVMAVLSIINEEIQSGTPLNEVAVINIDSLFSEMLYDSLLSLGTEANYSEGLAVKKSPLYQFLWLIHRFFKSRLDSRLFLQILRNEFFMALTGSFHRSSDGYRYMKKKLIDSRIFSLSSLSADYIPKDRKLSDTFNLMKNIYESDSFQRLYRNLRHLFSLFEGKRTQEFYSVRDGLLRAALELDDLSVNVQETPFEIFLHCAQSKRYTIPGVYDRGIQIVGLLETRGITFKTVIVPTFNEGYFPVRTESDILLPGSVRKALGLPTLLEREELEFYYLKRLVDASYRTYVLSIADRTFENGTRSRFSYLLEEWSGREGEPGRVNFMLPVSAGTRKPPKSALQHPSITTPVRTFSRMDIERLKRCETEYYIARVLGISETEEIRTDIELHRVGQLIHTVFHELYRAVDFDLGLWDARSLRHRLMEIFEQQFSEGYFFTSEEDLLKKIVKNKLIQSLQSDIRRFENGQRVCREYMEREFTAVVGREPALYTLRGRIDRVDLLPSGGYSIIDYKTGSIPNRKEHGAVSDFKRVQLGFYGLLFRNNFPGSRIDGLGYFDISGVRDIVTIVRYDEMDEYLTRFESHLIELLDAFNSKKSLSLADDPDNCRYCPYSSICRILEQ